MGNTTQKLTGITTEEKGKINSEDIERKRVIMQRCISQTAKRKRNREKIYQPKKNNDQITAIKKFPLYLLEIS